jgi:hypothetical protein
MVSVAPRNELFYFTSCLPAAAQTHTGRAPNTATKIAVMLQVRWVI